MDVESLAADFEVLRSVRVFAQLPAEDIRRILEQATRRAVPRGGYLFREDDASVSCFIVRSGRVQLLKRVDASHKQLATRRAGDLVGEIELLYGTPRMADALAASDVELFEVRQGTFDALIPDGRCRQAIFQAATDRLLQYQNALADADRRALQQLPTLEVRWLTPDPGPLARAYPFVAATTAAESGVACLAMIDRAHRRDSAWETHLEQLLAGGDHQTLVSLCRNADECGYRSRLLHLDAASLRGLELPVIMEDEDGSTAVLFEANRRGAVVGNPQRGLRRISLAELAAFFRGRVVAIAAVPDRPFGHLLHVNARVIASIALASAMLVVFGLVAPLASKIVTDRVVVTGDVALLRLVTVGVAVLIAFRAAAGLVREQLLVHAIRRAVLFCQIHLLDHVLRLPVNAAQRIGDVAGWRSSERLIESAAAVGLPLIADTLALAIGLGAVFFLSPPLAAIAVLFAAVYATVALTLPPIWRRERRDQPQVAARRYLIELVTGIQTVKTLAAEDVCTARGTKLMSQAGARDLEGTRARERRQVIGAALHYAALVAILGYGATLALAGRASAGDVVASLAIVTGLIAPLDALLDARGATRDLRRSATAMSEVLQLAAEESAVQGTAPRVTGHIRLSNVGFRYPGTQDDALTDINLEILPGQKVALIGRSGSGKTTLVNLLVGMYPPTRGTLHIDGTDIAAISKPALRRQLGIVEQHSFVFDGTVADNISRGDPSVTRERVIEAARLAGAHEFIVALPFGYDTTVGERGARLSGGERQRLTIARALIADPQLVVLDEATSALDSQTEHDVYLSLQRALAGRTMVLIAHRLSTVRHADVIVVLDRGRIAEIGSDAELVARRGLYYYLTTGRV